LSDGSEVEGWLESFNSASDETADRDLLLDAPIYYWRPENDGVEIRQYGSVVLSARTIVFLRVEYRNRETMQDEAERRRGRAKRRWVWHPRAGAERSGGHKPDRWGC
jgi:hypothetical protein